MLPPLREFEFQQFEEVHIISRINKANTVTILMYNCSCDSKTTKECTHNSSIIRDDRFLKESPLASYNISDFRGKEISIRQFS